MKIVYVVSIPDMTVTEAQKFVAGYDEELSGEGNGIAAEKVTGEDVLNVLFSGEISEYQVLVNQMGD